MGVKRFKNLDQVHLQLNVQGLISCEEGLAWLVLRAHGDEQVSVDANFEFLERLQFFSELVPIYSSTQRV